MVKKLIVYHTREDEKPFVDQWAKKNHVQVDTVPFELHYKTVNFAQGYDGVIFKQRGSLSSKENIYKKLHDFGIKQLSCRSAGIDSINLKWANKYHLTITNVPSYSPRAVAELVLEQAMQLVRHFPEFKKRVEENNYIVDDLRSRELSELTIGIIGVGRIGSTVAKIFHLLGAKVLGNDLKENPKLKGILKYTSKEKLLKNSDIVTIHVYYSTNNFHLIDRKKLGLLKPSAFFINDSRGPILDTKALIQKLKNRQIAGAALDVVEGEVGLFNKSFSGDIPNTNYKKLKSFQNVLLTPHIGFFTDHAVKNMVNEALDDALAILNGQHSKHEINLAKVLSK